MKHFLIFNLIQLFLLQSGIMVTGGEAGILNIWAPSRGYDEDITTDKCSLKEMPKISLKKRASKPY